MPPFAEPSTRGKPRHCSDRPVQERAAMEYMILNHSDENFETPVPGTPGFDEMMAGWLAYNQQLIDGGHWISAANLQPTLTATTIHKSFGAAPSVTDGPFAETKEQLGGFYLIK